MMCESHFHTLENVLCPSCSKPVAVLRGVNAQCEPIRMVVHRVNLDTWRPGTFKIA